MVISFAIPESSRRPLTLLSSLSEAQRDDLRGALNSLEALSPLATVRHRVAAVLPDLSQAEATELVQTLVAIAAQIDDEWSPAKVADLVSSSPSLDISGERRDALAQFLPDLLQLPALADTAKAVALMGEHERDLVGPRIVSDIRSIFGADPSQAPGAAGVVHTLLLDYMDAGESKRFTVALNPRDLVRLQREVERALAKNEALKKLLGSAGITYFESDEEVE